MTQSPQKLSNHARYVPLFHFVLGTLVVVQFLHAATQIARTVSADALWGLVSATALLILFWYVRAFPVGVQDRVIRLEMRLRLEQLLPAAQFARSGQLTLPQVVALRFAGDAELPALVAEVLDGKLGAPVEIKRRIRDWQADEARI